MRHRHHVTITDWAVSLMSKRFLLTTGAVLRFPVGVASSLLGRLGSLSDAQTVFPSVSLACVSIACALRNPVRKIFRADNAISSLSWSAAGHQGPNFPHRGR